MKGWRPSVGTGPKRDRAKKAGEFFSQSKHLALSGPAPSAQQAEEAGRAPSNPHFEARGRMPSAERGAAKRSGTTPAPALPFFATGDKTKQSPPVPPRSHLVITICAMCCNGETERLCEAAEMQKRRRTYCKDWIQAENVQYPPDPQDERRLGGAVSCQ
jgi:hypothetical protein